MSGIYLKNTIDFKKIQQQITDNTRTELARALEEEATEIVRQTTQGRDINGKPFAKYVPSYAKFKQAKGRNKSPDLQFTGKMLASITSKIIEASTRLQGRIFFGSRSEADKARGNMRKRRFFGLSKAAKQRIIQRLKRALKI